MHVIESIIMALASVRSHMLRSSLTLLSIGIGVFAIIASSGITGTLTQTLSSQLADLGENSMLIQRTPTLQFGGNWRKYQSRPDLTPEIARGLRQQMTTTQLISVSNTSNGYTVETTADASNPDVAVIGIDDLYFQVNAVSLQQGRSFTEQEVTLGSNVAIIGTDLLPLFNGTSPLGQRIKIRNQEFIVVGVLERKGGVLGQSQDNRVLLPLSIFIKYYSSRWDTSVDIAIKAYGKDAVSATFEEAVGIMRGLRDLKPWQENDFEIDLNEALAGQFNNLSAAIVVVAWVSGIGALLAAGIGIMNMMLVSVKERTREIGVRKALGAKRRWITRQFLIESITLCQLGGFTGVLGGLAVSYAATLLVRSSALPSLSFVWPLEAIIFSVVACTVIGVGFGFYPAWKAARLDPIEALRYE
jgi:putative ABC transport system permease protein